MKGKEILLLPGSRHAGSKGDEAMMTVLLTNFGKDHNINVSFPFPEIACLSKFDVHWLPAFDFPYDYSSKFRPKKWFFSLCYTLNIARLLLVRDFQLAVIGADSFGGNYYALLLFLIQAIKRNNIFVFGCSYREHPGWLSQYVFRHIPCNTLFVCSRDSLSERRFSHFTGKRSERVGDLAFLLEPRPLENPAVKVFLEKTKERPLLMVFPAVRGGFSFDYTMDQYLAAIKCCPEYAVLIVEHAGPPETYELCEAISVRLKNPTMVYANVDAQELRSVIAHARFAISSLMHPAIACFSMGKACMFTAYSDKEGVFDDFDARELIVRDPKEMVGKVKWLKLDHRRMEGMILRNLKAVQDLSNRNFEHFSNFIG